MAQIVPTQSSLADFKKKRGLQVSASPTSKLFSGIYSALFLMFLFSSNGYTGE
jgi:hypothetical protein